MSYPTFVAYTTSDRRPLNASASCCSLRPLPYVSAVSKKFTPWSSNARRMMAIASASLISPHHPVETVHVPNPTSLTRTSVPGNVRYRMLLPAAPPQHPRGRRGEISQNTIGPGPPDADQRLHHRPLAIDPSPLGGRA